MRRKYQLILIISISILIAYFIYFFNRDNKINIVALGDGVASGETSYNVDGISYNDYLKEYFESKKLLKKYNNSYAYKNYKLNDIINDLKDNKLNKEDKLNINQLIHKANIITISFGEEELSKMSMTNDLTKEAIKDFICEYDDFIYMLKDITDGKIIIIGLYENKYLNKSNVIILNSEISNIALRYNVIFLDISDLALNKNYYLDNKSFYFNYEAHEIIKDMIINSI